MFEREEHGPVRILRLAHGKASALDLELLRGLSAELAAVAESDARAVVLTGSRSIFSAGVDLVRLRDGGAEYVREFLPALREAFLALFALELPVVAAINGHAIAGGCVLACACDRRLMARGKGRIGVPELKVGVPFPFLALEIVRRVTSRADEVALLGRTYSAEEALGVGLVDELVDQERLMTRALEDARELADVPATSFALTKRGLRRPTFDRLDRSEAELDRAVLQAWTSDEARAAVADYVEKTLSK